MSGTDRHSGSGDPLGPITRGPLATFAVLLVAAAIVVVGGFGLISTRTPEPSGSPAQASPTASGEVPSEAWGAIGDLPPLEPVASLAPTVSDSAGIAPLSAFTLTSLGDIAATALAEGLSVEPSVALRTTGAPTAESVTVAPAEPLEPGQRYRFQLRTPDDALVGSWTFTVKAPLHVVTTVPGNQSTGVPLDTGIELTFDQDDVTGVQERFSIEPSVAGRFETHGRTLVFVPTALAPRTLYTVTLDAGVGVAGSDVTLEQPVRVRFETALGKDRPREAQIVLGRTVIEADPREPPVIALTGLEYDEDEGEAYAGGETPASLPVEVYRLPDQAAALAAARTLADAPEWAMTEAGLVDTEGLERVLAADVPLQQVGDSQALVLPERLPRGGYLAVVPREGRDAQALLQVTDLASYSLVSPTKTLVWVQRIGGGPVAGVEVAIADGAVLGTTDRHGLLVAKTPKALLRSDDATVLLTLTAPDGEKVLVPLGLTARVAAYPQDIHATIDEDLMAVLAPEAGRWAPAFALAARTALAAGRDPGDGMTLASVRGIEARDGAILADTSWAGEAGWIDDDRFWTILSTDRETYRQTDTIHLWGYLRERDTMEVPSDVRLRLLVAAGEYGEVTAPALETTAAKLAASGAFQGSFALKGVPLGSYQVQIEVAGKRVASHWVSVDVIRKPAYELTMAVDRHVRIDGQKVVATATARFFEGTVAPGVDVAIDAGRTQRAVTGPEGTASTTHTLRYPGYEEGMTRVGVEARVVGAEEGEITARAELVVLPSSRWLTGEGRLDGRRLRLEGTVSKAAIGALERQVAALEDAYWIDTEALDPKGAPIAGARVRVEVERQVITRTLSQQSYDFITKRVVPIYDEETSYVPVTSRVVRTDGDGRYSLAVRVPSPDATYRIRLGTTDGSGRTMEITVWTSPEGDDEYPFPYTYLEGQRDAVGDALDYGIGDRVRMTLVDQDGPYPSRDEGFLFVTAQRGLRDAVVQDSSRFRHAFTEADAPGLFVEGIHFNGRTFVHAGRWADFDPGERALTVRLEADRARYRPGDEATITVRTTDRGGRPAPASVTLRAVDEKLFAMGAAADEDPLVQLYASVGDGLYRSYTSHPLPQPMFGDGGGDTGGGREDFRDTLVYQQLETGPDGVGTTTVQLSDDLTSWRLSASAVTADLEAGVGSLQVPVGLPFFVEATLAPEFVLADQPALRLRAFGDALKTGDTATFTVTFPTLGGAPVTVSAKAFTPVDVPLPALQLGTHRLVVAGSARGGDLADTLTRTFKVVPARATRSVHAYAALEGERGIEAGPGLTTVTVSDAGRGSYLSVLEDLAWSDGPRLDQALSAIVARDLLVERYAHDPDAYPTPGFSADTYQRDESGLTLLAYGSPSHDHTVRALLVDPTRFNATSLRESMRSILSSRSATRERQIMALAGLALLGDDVSDAVNGATKMVGMTVRERLYLALAAATLGDQATAIDLERALVAELGERRGPWIRITDPESSDGSVEATAMLAIVMVEVGDPLADEAEAYVEANPMLDDLSSLQRLAYAQRALERAPTGSSRFAFTVDGARTIVDLEPGASHRLTLTEPQARSLRLEPISGLVGVSVTRLEPLDAAAVRPDPALTLTRTITPSGPITAGQVVTVELGISFSSQALKGCTEVVDEVPSGLAVSESLTGWDEDDEEAPAADALTPDVIAGQRVTFCAGPDPKRSVVAMRYHARVVGPGTYVWEPATAQSAIASELTTLTPASTVELR